MGSSRVIALLVGSILSAVGYFALQKSSFTFRSETVIDADLDVVFEYLRNPNKLSEINHLVDWVAVKNLTVDTAGVEEWRYLVSEELTHVGQQTWAVNSVVNPTKHTVQAFAMLGYGMLRIETSYRLKIMEDDSTHIAEECTVHVPWILQTFANKTLMASHSELLDMLKFVLEEEDTSFSKGRH